MKTRSSGLSNFIYTEWMRPIIDYYLAIKKNEAMFEIVLPAVTAVICTGLYNSFGDVSHALSALAELLPTAISILIGFTVMLITLLLTSSGESIDRLKKIAIDKELHTYRGIVVRQQEAGVYLLLWVDHHDEAYQWAARKRCEVNPKTGAIQVFDVQTVVEQVSAPEKVALFALAKDDDLLRLGVPEVQLDLVRSFVNKEDFYKSESAMPHDAYEHLSWLAEGFPMEEVLELVSEEQNTSASSEDLAAALDVPTTLKSFVVVDGEDELRRIMAEPLEKWRVFLHPTQRKIVQKEYSGSAKVLGGAGTGKTVVAMHRAKHLASKCEGQQRILMTTFTANLAADIRENLRKICTLEELRRIEVIHLDAWVNQFLRESGCIYCGCEQQDYSYALCNQ